MLTPGSPENVLNILKESRNGKSLQNISNSIPIQKVHPLDDVWKRALTRNRKRSIDLFVEGILLVIAVCFNPFKPMEKNKLN